jgi:hypothetical protein
LHDKELKNKFAYKHAPQCEGCVSYILFGLLFNMKLDGAKKKDKTEKLLFISQACPHITACGWIY